MNTPKGGSPIVEIPEEGADGRERPNTENRPAPNPHKSGRTLSEIRRAEEQPTGDRRNLTSLRERLGVRLNDDDFRIVLLDWQREEEGEGERPPVSQRAPSGSQGSRKERPLEHERAPPRNNPVDRRGRTLYDRNNGRRPRHVYQNGPSGEEIISLVR